MIAQSTEKSEDEKRYFTIGVNAGFIGHSLAGREQVSGTDHFNRRSRHELYPGKEYVYDYEGNRITSISSNFSGGLSFGYLFQNQSPRSISHFQFEFQYNKAYYWFEAPFSWYFLGSGWAAWVVNDQYFRYGISYERSSFLSKNPWLGEDIHGFYRIGLGQSFHHRSFGRRLSIGYTEDQTEDGQGLIMRTIGVNRTSPMITAELGIRSFLNDHRHNVNLGVVLYYSVLPSFTDEYEFLKDSASTGKELIAFEGTTIMLNMKYSFGFKTMPTSVSKDPDMIQSDPPVVSDQLGRDVEVQGTVRTSKKFIKVSIWDRGDVDGDSITIIMNGQVIVEHYCLQRRKRKFRLPLESGANLLVMYAENLGTIPPNTAAVIVYQGFRKKRLPLRSDLGKSGALLIERER